MNVNTLVELAMAVDIGDPIDWNMLHIKEENAFKMMADYVITAINSYNEEEAMHVLGAVCTKLMVENFVLNARLGGAEFID